MSFLLDTNVLSEPARPAPDPGVLAWLEDADEDRLFLSAVSLAELHHGVERLPDSKRRRRLHEWLSLDVIERFRGRILPIGNAEAEAWGRMLAAAEAKGSPIGVLDGFLAATARVHDLTIVTRNTADFAPILARVLNPWSAP